MTTSPATPQPPAAPRLPRALTPIDADSALEHAHDEGVEAASLDQVGLGGADLSNSTWEGVALRDVDLSEAALDGSRFADASIERSDLANVGARSASLLRTRVVGGRAIGIGLSEARIKDTTFEDVAFDLAHLRFARLSRVVFRNCRMHEVDFANAQFDSVLLDGCDLTGADFTKTSFTRCELRGSTLDEVRGLTSLTGVAMRWADVIALAPVFARALGVTLIAEDDDTHE